MRSAWPNRHLLARLGLALHTVDAVLRLPLVRQAQWREMEKGALRVQSPLFGKYVRLRPTLPHRHQCSTIGAEGLSFRVRNGTGRFPLAMTAETLWRCQSVILGVPDRISGTAQWTRSFFVVKLSAY